MDVQFYKQLVREEGPAAEHLFQVLSRKFNPQRILDVGCATGLYLRPFYKAGYDVLGWEINAGALALSELPKGVIQLQDITKYAGTGMRFDLVLCLETFEHIEESKAKAGITNLCKQSNRILFSAAIPGQSGEGHINCQKKEYWEVMFREQGFERRKMIEDELKKEIMVGYHMGWLISNLLWLEKGESRMDPYYFV